MEVAIITMHCPLNYGAALQTYALYRYLTNLGHSVKVIDYRPNYIVGNQSFLFIPEWAKKNLLVQLAYFVVKFPNKFYRRLIFKQFLNKHIKLTDKYKSFDELKANSPLADVYICGSDQIWGYSNNAYCDPSYFLEFVNNGGKRVSFAASGQFPQPLPEEMANITMPMIGKLDNISVREESVAKIISDYTGREVNHVVDPVFLLGKDEWESITPRGKFNEKFILVYAIGNNENVYKLAEKLSRKKNIPVYCITGSQRRDSRIDKYFCPSPTDFLSLFRNAECIVTNSFHGTAFSIIMEKEFYVCPTDIAPSRITSILKSAKRESAMVLDVDNYQIEVTGEHKSASSAEDSGMNNLIRKSKEYLASVLV